MLNKAILMGRLVADPELRRTPNNNSVTSFTLATNSARLSICAPRRWVSPM